MNPVWGTWGDIGPWLITCCKARGRLPFTIIELFSLSLTVLALRGEECGTRVLPMGVDPFVPKFYGNRTIPYQYVDTPRKVTDHATTVTENVYV